jgi:hypothetical protein
VVKVGKGIGIHTAAPSPRYNMAVTLPEGGHISVVCHDVMRDHFRERYECRLEVVGSTPTESTVYHEIVYISSPIVIEQGPEYVAAEACRTILERYGHRGPPLPKKENSAPYALQIKYKGAEVFRLSTDGTMTADWDHITMAHDETFKHLAEGTEPKGDGHDLLILAALYAARFK